MKNLWYKSAILYSLNVDTYMDSNGDGIGDFKGLTQRLDYLAGLGVTCLWLLPFYPTSNFDNGYDITDYYDVDPRLGTLGDFVEFMYQARRLGIKLIIDLVVNHTSIQHPWFQSARSDPESQYRNYYVWSDSPPENANSQVTFPGQQKSIWTYDEQAGAYYLHRFYKEQPDLNIDNPQVREEICKIIGFWLELGISGFRVDAAQFLIESVTTDVKAFKKRYEYLQEFREFLSSRCGDAIFLAEADVPPDKLAVYYGDGNRMHMLFNFVLNQYLFLALAREQSQPIIEGLQQLPATPPGGQWLNFLRNHDELNLSKLSPEEREEVFSTFAPDEAMQIYGRGIRCRLAPTLQGDRRRIELAYSLLFTLPDTPMLRYGDEIGMGDDLSLPGRASVRTVMQWSDTKNGGFSTASPETLVRSAIAEGEYGYHKVNVAYQQRDSGSLLNWLERVIRIRRQCPQLGWGTLRLLQTDQSYILAHCCEWEDGAVIAVHNLSEQDCTLMLNFSDYGYDPSYLIEIFADYPYEPFDRTSHTLRLQGYGYRWFRIEMMRQ